MTILPKLLSCTQRYFLLKLKQNLDICVQDKKFQRPENQAYVILGGSVGNRDSCHFRPGIHFLSCIQVIFMDINFVRSLSLQINEIIIVIIVIMNTHGDISSDYF